MKKGFTILELLLAIGVLSVMLAISVPAIGSAHTMALKKRAQSEATLLAQATMRYKSEYGFWPGQLTLTLGNQRVRYHEKYSIRTMAPLIYSGPTQFFKDLKITSEDHSPLSDIILLDSNEVYQAFSRIDSEQPDGRKVNPLNPKGIRFLKLKNEENLRTVSFPDPWGNPYVLIFGMNPKSTFNHQITHQGGATTHLSISNVTAFAFSFGPDGFISTNYIYSAGVK